LHLENLIESLFKDVAQEVKQDRDQLIDERKGKTILNFDSVAHLCVFLFMLSNFRNTERGM
jgi:hypothetical protein